MNARFAKFLMPACLALALLSGCLGQEEEQTELLFACYPSGIEFCMEFRKMTASPGTVAGRLTDDRNTFGTAQSLTMVSGRGSCSDVLSANSTNVVGYCDFSGTPYNEQGASLTTLYSAADHTNTSAGTDCSTAGGTYRGTL